MFGKKAPDVLVVGAGPVGLYSALVLARHKIPVTVVDKAWRPASRAYALALHGASLDLLEEVGLVGRVLEKARRVDTVGLYEGSDRKAEVRRFFEDYKLLENKQVSVDDFFGPAEARETIRKAMAAYAAAYPS